jgi:hypothetical protein
MRALLDQFLGGLCRDPTLETPSRLRQRQRPNQPYRTLQQYAAPALQPTCSQDALVLEKLANQIGALWYYIHHHNAVQRAKLDTTTYA